jgi:hypothetical protein
MRKTKKSRLVLTIGWTLLILITVAFAPPAAEPTTGNLVTNGDFSDGMTGWG